MARQCCVSFREMKFWGEVNSQVLALPGTACLWRTADVWGRHRKPGTASAALAAEDPLL